MSLAQLGNVAKYATNCTAKMHLRFFKEMKPLKKGIFKIICAP
jgi:hypothetical protein